MTLPLTLTDRICFKLPQYYLGNNLVVIRLLKKPCFEIITDSQSLTKTAQKETMCPSPCFPWGNCSILSRPRNWHWYNVLHNFIPFHHILYHVATSISRHRTIPSPQTQFRQVKRIRKVGRSIVFTHIFLTVFFLSSWFCKISYFIISFLFRALPLAFLLE